MMSLKATCLRWTVDQPSNGQQQLDECCMFKPGMDLMGQSAESVSWSLIGINLVQKDYYSEFNVTYVCMN